MKGLAQWLRGEGAMRGLAEVADSMSQILAQDHIPTIGILFRLAEMLPARSIGDEEGDCDPDDAST